MFQDKITLRVNSVIRKITKDHSVSYREKCRRARDAVALLYRDEELCITENLIKRADYLQRWTSLFYRDRYYTKHFELVTIHTLIEGFLSSAHDSAAHAAAPDVQPPLAPEIPAPVIISAPEAPAAAISAPETPAAAISAPEPPCATLDTTLPALILQYSDAPSSGTEALSESESDSEQKVIENL